MLEQYRHSRKTLRSNEVHSIFWLVSITEIHNINLCSPAPPCIGSVPFHRLGLDCRLCGNLPPLVQLLVQGILTCCIYFCSYSYFYSFSTPVLLLLLLIFTFLLLLLFPFLLLVVLQVLLISPSSYSYSYSCSCSPTCTMVTSTLLLITMTLLRGPVPMEARYSGYWRHWGVG